MEATIMRAIPRPVHRKAKPSRPLATTVEPAASSTTTSRPRIQVSTWRPSLVTYMMLNIRAHTRATAVAIHPSLAEVLRARSCMSPSVLRATKLAPWAQKSTTNRMPPMRANGVNRPQKEVVTSGATPPSGVGCGPTARPRTKFAKPTPSTKVGRKDPMVAIQSKVLRHFEDGCFERYSKETPRMMRPSSTSSSGR